MVEDEVGMTEALDDLRALLLDLEIEPGALTTELYTDAVARARAQNRFVMKPGDIVWDS
jgi:hypothetical protein